MKDYLHKLWLRVQEPRAVSVIYFFTYATVLALGLIILTDPPHAVQGTIGEALVLVWAGMLVAGGGIGATTALQGAWFIERAGSILCMFAMAIYGVVALSLPVTQLSLRAATLCFVLFSILTFLARLILTWRSAYDPER